MRSILFLVIFIMNLAFLFGQDNAFNEKNFFENLKTSYYSLQSTDTKNISVLLTNIKTESFAKNEWKNPEIFPIQLIWLSPDRLFLSQQGVPSLTDSSKNVYNGLVNGLMTQITDIIFDLKRFYFSDIYSHISDNYEIVHKNDVVRISFNVLENTDTTYFEYFFGLNGLCLQILSYTPSQKLKIETTPYFDTIKTKWIINSWEVKIYDGEDISMGYSAQITYKDKNNIRIPFDINLTVQSKSILGKTFNQTVKLRNFLFNQPLQYIEQ